ncbi:MAG: hypothetical protein K5695_06760 [Oscillospiraceae bacterium]|nr:hypothetical protein [Oscillospiraceae bacterium]
MLTNVLIVAATISLISLLIWAGICILSIHLKAKDAKMHDQRYTPGETIAGFVITGIIGQVILWGIAWLIMNATAAATVMLLQNRAQTVYETAVKYTEEPEHEKLHTVIGSTSDKYNYETGSVESEILRALSYDGSFWFAVTADKDGNVTGAYFAHHEITKKDLHPVDTTEQQKLLINPFGGEKAITGSWTMADQKLQGKFWGTQSTEEE